jgi:cell wall-associated NlpC family hydrolase
MDDLQPGDLVSYYGSGHSGRYAGDGTIDALTYGGSVELAPVSSMPVAGARRC